MDGASRILPALPPDLAARAEQSLCHLGARVRTGVKVTAIDSEGVTILAANKQERIATRTVLWAGGVSPSAFGRVLAKRIGAQTDRSGRIPVNPDLTVPGYPSIYVVGDLALAFRPDGTPLPGVAQVAIQQGAYAAHAIGRRLDGAPPPRPFHYFDRGDIAVIGRASAVANLFGLHVWGYPAWLVWVFIHLMYLVEFRSRLMVFIQWGFQYLTFSHGARLITGEVATSAPKTRTADHA
jgi:NADH dehydrogenase